MKNDIRSTAREITRKCDNFTEDYSRFVKETGHGSLDTRYAYKRGFQDGHARGLAEGEAKGLERAAEIIRNDVKSATENPTKPIAVTWSETFCQEAAKIREGK